MRIIQTGLLALAILTVTACAAGNEQRASDTSDQRSTEKRKTTASPVAPAPSGTTPQAATPAPTNRPLPAAPTTGKSARENPPAAGAMTPEPTPAPAAVPRDVEPVPTPAPATRAPRIVEQPMADPVQACMDRIPATATAGQRSMAEQSCVRDVSGNPFAPSGLPYASGTFGDSLEACMSRIPADASSGQRMIAEESCRRDDANRSFGRESAR